jgi:hypothetical protein
MAEAKKTVVKKKTLTPTPETVTETVKEVTVKPVTKKTAELDLIVKEASTIEKLTKDKAIIYVDDLLQSNDKNLFLVGGALAVIQDNGWFHDEGCDSLKEFVETRYNMKYRKAMYWIQIYKAIVESGVHWSQVSSIGWSKLRMIADVLTVDNVEEYVKIAKDMSQTQLYDYVKEQKKGSLEVGDSAKKAPDQTAVAEAKKLSTMTFKLHDDQKEVVVEALEVAKNDADTEFDAVALEAICMNFLSSGGAAKPAPTKGKKEKGFPTLKAAMAASGYEEVLAIFEELWPEVELSVSTEGEETESEEEEEEELD